MIRYFSSVLLLWAALLLFTCGWYVRIDGTIGGSWLLAALDLRQRGISILLLLEWSWVAYIGASWLFVLRSKA